MDWRDAQIDDPTEPHDDDPAPPLPSVPHRPWSTVLLVIHSLGLVVGLLALSLGAVAYLAVYNASPDPGETGESWGEFISMLFGVGGVAITLPSGALTRLCVVGRRNADEGLPQVLRSVGVFALVFAGLVAASSVVYGFPTGLVFCGLYALPAVFLLRTMRASPDAEAPHADRPDADRPDA